MGHSAACVGAESQGRLALRWQCRDTPDRPGAQGRAAACGLAAVDRTLAQSRSRAEVNPGWPFYASGASQTEVL